MSLKKKIILGLIVVLIGIQFFQPLRNQSGEVTDMHIEKVYAVPQNVKAILQISCYDCHSNNTRYPWYSRIQPGAWYMAGHIKEGKEELNFSDFGTYSTRKQRNKFRAMSNQIRDGKMPLSSYTLIHRNAVLTQEEKQVLMKWFDAMADSLK
ncbi:heme-binding domain-containing protein [Chitinophaga defluvii]|uniref:Heme-binding domain-containing protein n=1 Tax=Chitinophaga defluvii TaxID=3163343 RepID=A0ABV2TEK6_9BACT|nr:heme-binding domain-containing protein [Bacteroidota bacterium]MBS1771279.1 heme-binding domain-containing protein [Bacteroidota bacterium]